MEEKTGKKWEGRRTVVVAHLQQKGRPSRRGQKTSPQTHLSVCGSESQAVLVRRDSATREGDAAMSMASTVVSTHGNQGRVDRHMSTWDVVCRKRPVVKQNQENQWDDCLVRDHPSLLLSGKPNNVCG